MSLLAVRERSLACRRRGYAAGAALLMLAAVSAPARADPLTLLLLKLLRDQIVSHSLQSGMESLAEQGRAMEAARQAPTFGYPPVTFQNDAGLPEEEALRVVIDQSFPYLSAQQRTQVHAQLMKTLDDPANREQRPQIVADFRTRALQVKTAYQQLDRLSSSEKKALAQQAREAYGQLAPEERRELIEVLRAGTLPVPPDLNRAMLAAFDAPAVIAAP